MEFKKYNSITNHYDKQFLKKFLEYYPELFTEKFCIQPKIDGANFSVWFLPSGEIKFAKRSGFIGDDDFYGCKTVLKETNLLAELASVQQYAMKENVTVTLFGELFGQGIQKRINYNLQTASKKGIMFYDIKLDNIYLDFWKSKDFKQKMDIEHLFVPYLAVNLDLEDALSFNNEMLCFLNPTEGNYEEGVVIRPQSREYFNAVGERLIIKSKSDKFAEKMKTKTKVFKDVDPEVQKWINEYHSYLTKNRALSVISKRGPMETMSELGEYIKDFIQDSKEDFFKDHLETLKEANINISEVIKPGNIPAKLFISIYKED